MAGPDLAPAPSKAPALDAAPLAPPQQAPAPIPAAPQQAAPLDAPGVDLRGGKLPNRADLQERTAAEYAQKIDPRNSYAIDIIREDGVVVRDQGRFYRTPGNDRAGGGYITGADGVKYHNTGTTDDGRVLAKHKVEPNGTVTFKPTERGPRAFTTEINDMIDQLGLTQLQEGSLTFNRRGFSGIYTLQLEKDGSFSVHYAGGRNSAGERCYSQTYHHGSWDYGRSAKLDAQEQQARWTRWQNREQNEATTVAVSHHEPVAKASSGFHTAASSSTVNDQGKLTAATAALTTAEQQQAISKISADQNTWSATYVHIPAAEGQPATVPPSYSFACQQNGVSGVLNIKQSTLDGLAPDLSIIGATYSLSVNHYNESQASGQAYRSLLTDTRMLLRGENGSETIVSLRPNGNVVDHSNNREYHIQVRDGEPITWVVKQLETQPVKDTAAPIPSNIPSLDGNEPTSVQKMTAQDIEATKKANLERSQILATQLHTANSASALHIDSEEKITIPSDTTERTNAAVAFKSANEANGPAYVFTRKIGTETGILFARENELKADTSEAAKVVAATYQAKTNPDQTLKLEDWHQIDNNTKTRIRSDGSVEMHKSIGTNTEYSIIAPYKKEGGGIEWKIKEGELDSSGRVVPKSKTPSPIPPAQTSSTTPTAEPQSLGQARTYTEEEVKKAHDYALTVFTKVDSGNGLWSFSKLLEQARQEGLSELVQDEYKKLDPNSRGLTIAAHYYSENPSHRDVESHLKTISFLCEPEANKALVEKAYDLYYRVAGVTDNEGLMSFALENRKDWPQIERIFDRYWSSYHSGDTRNPITANQAMKDELGITTTQYMAIQHFVSGNPDYKFDPMSVANQLKDTMLGYRINDNEEAFVNLVEMVSSLGKLPEVDSEVKRLTSNNYSIKGIIEAEGFSYSQLERLQKALKGYVDIKLPEPEEPLSFEGPYTSI